jgi:hypothetical protein
MGARRRLVLPAWTGFLLIASGFLSFVVSYFLLPLYVTTVNCFDTCTPPKHATAWEFSLNLLSHLPGTPVTDTFLLVLCYLPLLAAVTVVGCSIGFLVHPQRTFATWSSRSWLTGSIALVLLLLFWLLFLSIFVRPAIGYLGMLFGYGFLRSGNRVFLTVRP